MGKPPDFSSLPIDSLLRIFKCLPDGDLFQTQQVCQKFKTVIESLKKMEIKNDFRLEYLKYEKFNSEISAGGAIKALNLTKRKNGNCSVELKYLPRHAQLENLEAMNAFNEVVIFNHFSFLTKNSLFYEYFYF